MKKFFDIEGKTDEELLEEYSADLEGKTFVPSRLIDAIGQRKARLAIENLGTPEQFKILFLLMEKHLSIIQGINLSCGKIMIVAGMLNLQILGLCLLPK